MFRHPTSVWGLGLGLCSSGLALMVGNMTGGHRWTGVPFNSEPSLCIILLDTENQSLESKPLEPLNPFPMQMLVHAGSLNST